MCTLSRSVTQAAELGSFLQASLDFSVVEVEGGSKTWLQLYREGRTGKKKHQGEVQVAAWFEEAGALIMDLLILQYA